MQIDQAELAALRDTVRHNTGDEMLLLGRFTFRGLRQALGIEQESGIEALRREGMIVEKADYYEFAPEIQRALVREELGESMRIAEGITRARLGNNTAELKIPDMHKGSYQGEVLGSSKWHVIQRVGESQTAVAHLKSQLNTHEVFGMVEITYSGGQGRVAQVEEPREQRRTRSREMKLRG